MTDSIALSLRQVGHRFALGPVLAQQSVRVLIRPPSPWVVRPGEVDRHSDRDLHFSIAVKFGAVVGCDRQHRQR